MEKYYVISGSGDVMALDEWSKLNNLDSEFFRFAQIESGGQADLADGVAKSDYLKIARRIGFDWEGNSAIGFMSYDWKANKMMELVKELARRIVDQIGFPIYEVRGSNFFDLNYPVVQSYAQLFDSRLFKLEQGKHSLVMGYDASYPQFDLASKMKFKKADLPFGHFSISDCYRFEQSGECMLMYRLRRFFMPDLHPYFKSVEQAFEWYPKIEKQIVDAAALVGREYQLVIEVPSDEVFEQYRSYFVGVAENFGRDVLVKVFNDGKNRYWIINADYKIVDQLDQSREIACIQVDIGNAKRLGIRAVDMVEGEWPAIIHAAVPGGLERFLYMVLDGIVAGGSMPFWLAPVQARLIPVSQGYAGFVGELVAKHKAHGLRIDSDCRGESVGKRVRVAKENFIPKVLVIGEKEVKGGGNLKELDS